jgi:hypothetical protein
MKTSVIATVTLLVAGCVGALLTSGCQANSAGGSTLAPTTQQSLAQAAFTLGLEKAGYTAASNFLNSEIAAKKVTNTTLIAAIQSAEVSIPALLASYQADITAGNLAALQLDQSNVEAALAPIVADAADAALQDALSKSAAILLPFPPAQSYNAELTYNRTGGVGKLEFEHWSMD